MVKFIIAIVAGSIFVLLFLIGVILYFYRASKEKALQESINNMYVDGVARNVDFDFSTYDEETARILSASMADGQLTIDDVIIDRTPTAPDEGLEEITGNYKPEQ